MGRKAKVGLDFWQRDIGLFRDPKLRKPRMEHGYLAPYVYECLLDILYGDKGYYIDYREDNRENVLWQISELTQGKYAPDINKLADVVDSLAACGLFSGDLYRLGIITSKRAQKDYFSAISGRTSANINFDIWLLSEDEMQELNPNGKNPVLQSFISWREKRISGREKHISCQESTQRREEEKRVEYSREDKSIVEYSREDERKAFVLELADELEKLIDDKIDKGFRKEIQRLANMGMEKAIFLEAANITTINNPKEPAPYLRRVLQNYEQSGKWTAADLKNSQRPRNAAPSCEEPTGELKDWEKDWLREVQARKNGSHLPSQEAKEEA